MIEEQEKEERVKGEIKGLKRRGGGAGERGDRGIEEQERESREKQRGGERVK